MATTFAQTYSVTEYVAELNANLANVSGTVIGEVSEVKTAASGHAYFTMKDKETGDILPCTIWRFKYILSSVDLEVGMEILARGKPNFYGPFGKLSFIADSVELVGEGALLKAYAKLKSKLEEEGAFDPSKKKMVPDYPHKIGVVTSVHGEVIHDFSKNLRKYGYKVTIIDTRVEGPESGKELALSVRAMRKMDLDVLVLLRGGGSVQSLAGFDNEALVREILSFPKPVIAGIGHHRDVPLAALAADAMESTPSLVAELLNQSWRNAEHSLRRSEQKIFTQYQGMLAQSWRALESVFVRIERALTKIFAVYGDAERSIRNGVSKINFALRRVREQIRENQRIIQLRYAASIRSVRTGYLVKIPTRIATLYDSQLRAALKGLQQSSKLIESNDPARQLRLGYSLTFANGLLVRSSAELQKGSILTMTFGKGGAEAEITQLS